MCLHQIFVAVTKLKSHCARDGCAVEGFVLYGQLREDRGSKALVNMLQEGYR